MCRSLPRGSPIPRTWVWRCRTAIWRPLHLPIPPRGPTRRTTFEPSEGWRHRFPMRSPWCASHLRLGPEEPPKHTLYRCFGASAHTNLRVRMSGSELKQVFFLSRSCARRCARDPPGNSRRGQPEVDSLRVPKRPAQAHDDSSRRLLPTWPGTGPAAAEPSLLVTSRLPGTTQLF